MRDFIRLLTGRIAYERRSRLLAAKLGAGDEYLTMKIYCFLLTEEFPR